MPAGPANYDRKRMFSNKQMIANGQLYGETMHAAYNTVSNGLKDNRIDPVSQAAVSSNDWNTSDRYFNESRTFEQIRIIEGLPKHSKDSHPHSTQRQLFRQSRADGKHISTKISHLKT